MIIHNSNSGIRMNNTTVEITPGSHVPFPEEYWRNLYYVATDTMTTISFSLKDQTSFWNIPAELKWAADTSDNHVMLALAFITNCQFQHSITSSVPFSTIAVAPKYPQVRDMYINLYNFIPDSFELTSELVFPQCGTMFKRVPYKVVQHAVLDTTTFELCLTHAMVYWEDGGEPVRYEGIFVPRAHCELLWSSDH